jgi:hypothetical protein
VCKDGFFQSNGFCVGCNSKCKTCNWMNSCTSCFSDMVLANSACCPDKCSSCSFEVCWTCRSSYFLINGNCEMCPENCSGCDAGVCSGCKEGNYLVGSMCFSCVAPCRNCFSDSGCLDCVEGFVLSGTNCVRSL